MAICLDLVSPSIFLLFFLFFLLALCRTVDELEVDRSTISGETFLFLFIFIFYLFKLSCSKIIIISFGLEVNIFILVSGPPSSV